ncbi:MAG: hypothetical protein AAF657_25680 [Acidobacteriota bacterium]
MTRRVSINEDKDRILNLSTKNMAVTLTLTPDIEQALTAEASDQGTTPELLALESLRRRFVGRRREKRAEGAASSLADLIGDQVGVLSSTEQVPGGARMSENSGADFAAALIEKRRRKQL